MVILLNWWILPVGGVASVKGLRAACLAGLLSTLVGNYSSLSSVLSMASSDVFWLSFVAFLCDGNLYRLIIESFLFSKLVIYKLVGFLQGLWLAAEVFLEPKKYKSV